jgi:hypothetical protein
MTNKKTNKQKSGAIEANDAKELPTSNLPPLWGGWGWGKFEKTMQSMQISQLSLYQVITPAKH